MPQPAPPPAPLDGYLIFDVHDPDELGADSAISRRFPSSNNAHRYRLIRPPPIGKAEVLTKLAMRPAGDLLAAYVGDTFGTEVEVIAPGARRYCLSVVLSEAMQMQLPGGSVTDAGAGRGLVYRGDPGVRFRTEDGCARWNLWVDATKLETALEGVLGQMPREPLSFAPILELDAGPGASLARLLELTARELAMPEGLAANPITRASLADLIMQTMLVGLPHSYRDALERKRRDRVAPATLRRAEAFMRAGVDRPLPLEEVAAAAGCSLRALHAAFRQFRDTTPLAALQAARLEAAHDALAQAGESERVMDVVRRYGFTNRSRLARAYERRFGTPLPQDRGRYRPPE